MPAGFAVKPVKPIGYSFTLSLLSQARGDLQRALREGQAARVGEVRHQRPRQREKFPIPVILIARIMKKTTFLSLLIEN